MSGIRRGRGERGLAAQGALIASTFAMLIMAGLTIIVIDGVKDSARAVGAIEARGIAEAGAEEMFSRTITNPDFFNTTKPGNYTSHPAIANPHTWWHFDEANKLRTCPAGDGKTPCFQIRVGPETTSPSNPDAVSIQVLGTSSCRSNQRRVCDGVAGIRQTVRRRSFLEFLIHADSESLDANTIPANLLASYPSGCDTRHANRSSLQRARCLDAVYHGVAGSDDELNGPIHTNDSRIIVCGTPKFTGGVEVAHPRTGSGWVASDDPGCTGNSPSGTFTTGPQLSLPFTRADNPGYNPFATALAIANDGYSGSNPYVLADKGTPATIRINGQQLIINGTTLPFPDSGVVYSHGSVDVHGRLDGRLSIVSSKDINIVGDLVYACAMGGGHVPIPANCDDALGLNAKESVVIRYAPEDRVIHAAMAAVNRSIHVDRWLTADRALVCSEVAFVNRQHCLTAVDTDDDGIPELTVIPKLFIRGAIVGHYRGVYGAYDEGRADIPTGTEGELISGFAKRFTYDNRFKNQTQPPYFVEPVASGWARIDSVDVRIDPGAYSNPGGPTTTTTTPTTTTPTSTTSSTVPPTVPTTTTTTTTTTAPPTSSTTTTTPGPTSTVPVPTSSVSTTTSPPLPTTTTTPTSTSSPPTTSNPITDLICTLLPLFC